MPITGTLTFHLSSHLVHGCIKQSMPNVIYIQHIRYTNSITERRRKSVREYTYEKHISKQFLIFLFSEAIQMNIHRLILNKKTTYSDLLRDSFRILYSNNIYKSFPVTAIDFNTGQLCKDVVQPQRYVQSLRCSSEISGNENSSQKSH